MGEQRVSLLTENEQMHRFVRHLLKDVRALEYMIENDWFEKDITRIGAEQEMCLIDKHYKPVPKAMEALKHLKGNDWVETELAAFNLECNLTPRELKGKCFSEMETEVRRYLNKIQEKTSKIGADVLLTGILPTLRKSDLGMHNLTPKKRYAALMNAITEHLLGNAFELRLRGVDEILVKHDSPLLEACNTSFQVHYQVTPDNFAKMYNIAQALAAPIIAISANSSVLFGRRVWHETRIALFQQALDTRTTSHHMRERCPRVTFGNGWLKESIMEIYKEDILRFRVLISGDIEEDAYEMIKDKKTPKLRALQVHNSTVYRWNRPCYGISPNGQPHLRIENRVLPAGPTVIDEVANAAFWVGLMTGMEEEIGDVTKIMSFEDARDNFGKAARFGIDTKFTWFNNEKISAVDLILNQLIPIAKRGLQKRGIAKGDIKRYLDIIKGRAENHMNGARWTLRTFTKLIKQTNRDEAVTALTAAILENQRKSKPVHKWKLPELEDLKYYKPVSLTVGDFMETDLFTVQKSDIIELVADMMEWRKLNHTAVEDKDGHLIGLITARKLLKHFTNKSFNGGVTATVEDIMIPNPVTVTPETTMLDAIDVMNEHKVRCLPVVKDGELIGMLTHKEMLQLSSRLLKRFLKEEDK